MEKIEINKKFATHKECQEWEKEHLDEFIPKGKVMLCAFHTGACGTEEETLDYLLCV